MGICVRVFRGLVLSGVVLAGLLVGSIAVNVAVPSVADAQTANAIVVEGNRRVEAETIRSYFRPGPGGRLDAVSIDSGLKALFATGLFQDVRTRHAGGRLIVTVVENPVINRVAFEGNKKVKDEVLALEVQSKARGTLSRPTVQADTQRIIEIYRRNGRFDVRVEPKIIELPNGRVNLVFEVSEGEKTGIKDVRFVGNRAISSYRLKDVIKTTRSNFFSFLQTNDIYDPDRLEADRNLLRRFYLKRGFADVRIISAVGEYDPSAKGFIVTFTIDEGSQYKVGTVDVISNVNAIDPKSLRAKVHLRPGRVYNAELVEKTVEDMTVEAAKRGYAFANVRPRGDRNFQTKVINLVFLVEEGARVYIERINVRGNIRTRDYVIRREFDIGEGDAYNRALIERAERRLKNLDFFKSVKITNEPGSTPDRVVVNVDVEEKSTGEFSIAGGYSTADGFLAEVSVADRNLLGRGQFAKVAVQYGENVRGFQVSYAEPYFLGYRMAAGIDVFVKQNYATEYVSYETQSVGSTLRLGFGLTEEISLKPHYSIYRTEVELPTYLNDCLAQTPPVVAGNPCYANGEATLAVRRELASGPVLTSLLGYTVAYNTLDNNRNPSSGMYATMTNDFAGIGGDVKFVRTTGNFRTYHEIMPDIIGVVHLQGGHATGWGGDNLRMLDHFQMGPNLVRGFSIAGIGPRDLSAVTADALGGSMYWGASVEVQTPLFFLPKMLGMKLALFADAGSLWDYQGPTTWSVTGETITPQDSSKVRSSVGAGLLWDSPLGPIRIDFAHVLSKESYDNTQFFRFSGGAKF